MDVDDLVTRLLRGERRALARTLSLVEGGEEQMLRQVIAAVHPHTGRAHLVGITGSPGAGKSTLTSALTAHLRKTGRTVAVLAIDPSSPYSGGALLGDRIRMADHTVDDGVYIRSMATRGHLGGLSWATPQALLVLDAAGFDVVIVETVGVGQAEVEIAGIADTTIVVQAPGMGDTVQAAKAGILEVADIHVVNKADRPGAHRTVRELQGMLALGTPGDWTPPILQTTASTADGVPALADAVDDHRDWATTSGHAAEHRWAAARLQIREIMLADLRRRLTQLGDETDLEQMVVRVANRELDPYTAADELAARL